MGQTYGHTLEYQTGRTSVSGASSPLVARAHVYEIAIRAGDYTPPKLRRHWWQFWRPAAWPQGVAEALAAIQEAKDA
jgi:hypothetical protein